MTNRTIRWTRKSPRKKEEMSAVPGYDKPATKPLKYPGGWL